MALSQSIVFWMQLWGFLYNQSSCNKVLNISPIVPVSDVFRERVPHDKNALLCGSLWIFIFSLLLILKQPVVLYFVL